MKHRFVAYQRTCLPKALELPDTSDRTNDKIKRLSSSFFPTTTKAPFFNEVTTNIKPRTLKHKFEWYLAENGTPRSEFVCRNALLISRKVLENLLVPV